jgi:hypothetical protein
MKSRGERSQRGQRTSWLRSRRKRSVEPDSNNAFLQAFADALRDILEAERRGVA